MAPPKQKTCQFGHDNWRYNTRGDRECRTCRNDRRRVKRTQVKRPTYGSLWDTMTYSEIVRARGL